jgi:hypothetical protein
MQASRQVLPAPELRKVFTKLGISCRRELDQALSHGQWRPAAPAGE